MVRASLSARAREEAKPENLTLSYPQGQEGHIACSIPPRAHTPVRDNPEHLTLPTLGELAAPLLGGPA
jgi:hypothetical protein